MKNIAWLVGFFVLLVAAGCLDTVPDYGGPDTNQDTKTDTNSVDFNSPDLNVPDFNNIPDYNIPDSNLPDVNLNDYNSNDYIPDVNLDVNIPVIINPNITITTNIGSTVSGPRVPVIKTGESFIFKVEAAYLGGLEKISIRHEFYPINGPPVLTEPEETNCENATTCKAEYVAGAERKGTFWIFLDVIDAEGKVVSKRYAIIVLPADPTYPTIESHPAPLSNDPPNPITAAVNEVYPVSFVARDPEGLHQLEVTIAYCTTLICPGGTSAWNTVESVTIDCQGQTECRYEKEIVLDRAALWDFSARTYNQSGLTVYTKGWVNTK